MPTTRKKQIKTIYKNSDSEEETGDFSDSGSDAKIPEESSSDDDEEGGGSSSGDDFKFTKKKPSTTLIKRRPKFAKSFINSINKNSSVVSEQSENHEDDTAITNEPVLFSVKDLTDADKLLPSTLNLSESDSSDDESPKAPSAKNLSVASTSQCHRDSDSDNDLKNYRDVFSANVQDESAEIAKKAFLELERQKNKIEETKASIQYYKSQQENAESDVNDLLALGEVGPNIGASSSFVRTQTKKKIGKSKKAKEDSDSDLEDWEEVNEKKELPAQGLQLFVEFPDAVRRRDKKIDVEMMMKRKINRVKKEYQVYMHKVHVLCWLGHGNYVSRVLNDQDILAAALALVPSKDCYPGERVDMKYLEQITSWYKDKIILKQDKNEDKYRPKAPHLKEILTSQMKKKTATAKKYVVYIFIAMLRALGLQCRVMFNFVTLPMKPPTSELCSLSTKQKTKEENSSKETTKKSSKMDNKTTPKSTDKTKKNVKVVNISQLDGNNDSCSDYEYENIKQLDGNDDSVITKTRTRTRKAKSTNSDEVVSKEDVSPPKKSRNILSPKEEKSEKKSVENIKKSDEIVMSKDQKTKKDVLKKDSQSKQVQNSNKLPISKATQQLSPRKTRNSKTDDRAAASVPKDTSNKESSRKKILNSSKSEVAPKIVVTNADEKNVCSKFFSSEKSIREGSLRLSRKRSQTANPAAVQKQVEQTDKQSNKNKSRTKSAPGNCVEKNKYLSDCDEKTVGSKKPKLCVKSNNVKDTSQDSQRVSHRDLAKGRPKPKGDVTGDLVDIIKKRVKEAKEEAKKGLVKGKSKNVSDEDSDFLPEEDPKKQNSESDEDFKPTKISPKASITKKPNKKDRRVLSSDEDAPKNKIDVWCEVYVEELEQWISVEVISGKIHCPEYIYGRATHPVCYVVGWDDTNRVKDVTRRYVPHWNTVTRKLRADPHWWEVALQPWQGVTSARDREEDVLLDRMQLEAPLPKSIAEYKNHPLYVLQRHLLKFEALYPADVAPLGFVRGEAVYPRSCVFVCHSRDVWLKEAKVVRPKEQPYKIVKARPTWDKLNHKIVSGKSLEIFGPWQVEDYEPPTAENGIVPRNAYGNVELFKECMLPKGTVHMKLAGLNKVCRKLNVDCAPALTGFDSNGGWSYPIYDGVVVCQEYQEMITEAWIKDQEEQERKEIEKMEARVYGNWKRLIRGLFIRERLKSKYGFEEPTTSQVNKKKAKAPRLVVKKK